MSSEKIFSISKPLGHNSDEAADVIMHTILTSGAIVHNRTLPSVLLPRAGFFQKLTRAYRRDLKFRKALEQDIKTRLASQPDPTS